MLSSCRLPFWASWAPNRTPCCQALSIQMLAAAAVAGDSSSQPNTMDICCRRHCFACSWEDYSDRGWADCSPFLRATRTILSSKKIGNWWKQQVGWMDREFVYKREVRLRGDSKLKILIFYFLFGTPWRLQRCMLVDRSFHRWLELSRAIKVLFWQTFYQFHESKSKKNQNSKNIQPHTGMEEEAPSRGCQFAPKLIFGWKFALMERCGGSMGRLRWLKLKFYSAFADINVISRLDWLTQLSSECTVLAPS